MVVVDGVIVTVPRSELVGVVAPVNVACSGPVARNGARRDRGSGSSRFRSDSHGGAVALGHASAVGMVETFPYLLCLDSSVLNRGRAARQSPVSARPEIANKSKTTTNPQNRHCRNERNVRRI